MKNNLLSALLILYGHVLYAQDVVTPFRLQNGPETTKVQNTPPIHIDSTELLIDLLSKDSLVYRPEGDPFIISLIKQNDLRSMKFLLLHCHERPFIHIEGTFDFEDNQRRAAREFYIEDLINNYGDKWIFVSAFSEIIEESELSDDRLRSLCSIMAHFFAPPTYKSIFLEMERFAPPLALKNISKFKSKLSF